MEDKTFQSTKGNSHQSQRVVALYSDIGRGHSSYLDSLLYLLKEKYPRLVCRTVFSESGPCGQESKGLSLLCWKFLSWLYNISGKGGLQTKFYILIRQRSQKGSKDSLGIKILGRDLKRAYENFPGICLVDHPIVARSLADICRVWYVHGEIAAPAECAIQGVERILAPLNETKEMLIACGAEKEAVVVCGLMIEPPLVEGAERAYQERVKRINKSNLPLTVGFFTSGAYPKEHMEKIILGAFSVIQKKMKAIIFCGTNPHKFEWVKNKVSDWGAKIVEDKEETSHHNEEFDLKLVGRPTRQEDTQCAVQAIPDLDVFVAASHERTNWAVGLGLPMFVLFPLIGTYASQNFEFAQAQKVIYPLDSPEEAKNLGEILSNLRQSGQLLQMAQNGFGVHSITGIETAVAYFIKDSKC
ncbi:MAG: hypothetical protein KAW02_02750 [candidate division Zixibacteria bacterium]|nr:hypothetical protein [candidate division Zixibacteria bacterium]